MITHYIDSQGKQTYFVSTVTDGVMVSKFKHSLVVYTGDMLAEQVHKYCKSQYKKADSPFIVSSLKEEELILRNL